jgi:hypothetical protein
MIVFINFIRRKRRDEEKACIISFNHQKKRDPMSNTNVLLIKEQLDPLEHIAYFNEFTSTYITISQ